MGKKTPAQGVSTALFAPANPLLHRIGGVYLTNDVSPFEDEPRQLTVDRIPAAVA